MIGSILASLFTLENFLVMNLGVAVGIIFGAIPGLSAVIGITLLLPITYSLSIVPSLCLLIGVYCGGVYGGSITAILIDTPGAPAAACTVLDGHPMAKKGKAGRALNIALRASFFGGIVSTVLLIVCGPSLSSFALKFGPAEMFGLCLIGLMVIPSVVGNQPTKGFLAALFGLFVTVIGSDIFTGMTRLSFGVSQLQGGINLAPTMIGIFAFSQVIKKVYNSHAKDSTVQDFKKQTYPWKELLSHWKTLIKSTLIGTGIGAIPGTGPALAAFVSYNAAKESSKHPEEFGTGIDEGIIAPESANNAVTGAAFIPLLSLGIPGDTATAVLAGAMTIAGVAPGPTFYSTHASLAYTIMAILVVVNIFLLLQASVFVKMFARIAVVPTSILFPVVGIFCILGAYASGNSMFDVWVMIIFGFIGFFVFEKFNLPKAPFIIARILGSMTEVNLRRALQLSDNGPMIFFTHPISLICILICIFIVCLPLIRKIRMKRVANQ